MKRKELTETFMMILNWTNPFGFHGLYKNISSLYGLSLLDPCVDDFTVLQSQNDRISDSTAFGPARQYIWIFTTTGNGCESIPHKIIKEIENIY